MQLICVHQYLLYAYCIFSWRGLWGSKLACLPCYWKLKSDRDSFGLLIPLLIQIILMATLTPVQGSLWDHSLISSRLSAISMLPWPASIRAFIFLLTSSIYFPDSTLPCSSAINFLTKCYHRTDTHQSVQHIMKVYERRIKCIEGERTQVFILMKSWFIALCYLGFFISVSLRFLICKVSKITLLFPYSV